MAKPILSAVLYLLLAGPAAAQASGSASEPLSRADFVVQMDSEFARFDADRNGVITAEEIVAAQRRAAQSEALRQNAAVFAGLDKNKDGKLSSEEFAALANPDAIAVDARPLMQQFDGDRDGVVTWVEYRIATQANFDKIDSDRNGIVNDVEMRSAGIVK